MNVTKDLTPPYHFRQQRKEKGEAASDLASFFLMLNLEPEIPGNLEHKLVLGRHSRPLVREALALVAVVCPADVDGLRTCRHGWPLNTVDANDDHTVIDNVVHCLEVDGESDADHVDQLTPVEVAAVCNVPDLRAERKTASGPIAREPLPKSEFHSPTK